MYENDFQERLANLRNKKGVSARDMSLSIGQNAGYINNIETGKALPSMSGFFYICEYLNITPKDFFDTDTNLPETINEIVDNLKKLDEDKVNAIKIIVSEMKK